MDNDGFRDGFRYDLENPKHTFEFGCRSSWLLTYLAITIFSPKNMIAYSTNNIEIPNSNSQLISGTMFNVNDDLPHYNTGMPEIATVEGIMKTKDSDGNIEYEVVKEKVETDDLYYIDLSDASIFFNDKFYYLESPISIKPECVVTNNHFEKEGKIKLNQRVTIPKGTVLYGANDLEGYFGEKKENDIERFFWMDEEQNLIVGNIDDDNMRRIAYNGDELWDVESNQELTKWLQSTEGRKELIDSGLGLDLE